MLHLFLKLRKTRPTQAREVVLVVRVRIHLLAWLHAHEATAAHGHLERVEQLADIRHPLQAPLKFLERPSLNLIVAAFRRDQQVVVVEGFGSALVGLALALLGCAKLLLSMHEGRHAVVHREHVRFFLQPSNINPDGQLVEAYLIPEARSVVSAGDMHCPVARRVLHALLLELFEVLVGSLAVLLLQLLRLLARFLLLDLLALPLRINELLYRLVCFLLALAWVPDASRKRVLVLL
mmetsp:Transcript_8518/g.31477  ORF Transcript_8518/g.31477 Transcript_8518/m.31477 type:complete len:236 (+) Transcript_8518:58-765(+)